MITIIIIRIEVRDKSRVTRPLLRRLPAVAAGRGGAVSSHRHSARDAPHTRPRQARRFLSARDDDDITRVEIINN